MAKKQTPDISTPLTDDESLKKYMAIAQAVQRKHNISKEDAQYLMAHTPQNEEELKSLREKMDDAQKRGIVPKELNEQVGFAAVQSLLQSDQYKSVLAESIADTESSEFSGRLKGALNLALAGTDVAQSLNQIQQSKNAFAKSVRPGRPGQIAADQNLQQALRQGQQGTYDVSKQLAPAQAAANDQYLADIQNAKTASAGQSGAFGVYTQAAANRRNRAGLEQSALGAQIMQQNRQNQAGLLGLKQQENKNIFDSRAATYGTDMDQYQREQAAAANTAVIGRENLNTGINSLASAGSDYIVDAARQRKLNMLYNTMDKYKQGPQSTAAHTKLAGYYGGEQSTMRDPYLQQVNELTNYYNGK